MWVQRRSELRDCVGRWIEDLRPGTARRGHCPISGGAADDQHRAVTQQCGRRVLSGLREVALRTNELAGCRVEQIQVGAVGE
jgi:hypothetical protein